MRYQGMDYRFHSLVGSVCDISFVLSYPLDRVSEFPIGVGNECYYVVGNVCCCLIGNDGLFFSFNYLSILG